MTKTDKFVKTVGNLASTINTDYTKLVIDDSTQNNRGLSVNQLVRYLSISPFPEDSNLATSLSKVKNFLLKNKLLQRVRRNNNRTDAYEIKELLVAMNRYVVKNPIRKSVVGRLIKE